MSTNVRIPSVSQTKHYRKKFHNLGQIDTTGFYVIAVCSNPVRYSTRYKLFTEFTAHMADLGVDDDHTKVEGYGNLIVVEQAFGDRPFEITSSDNKNHLQLRTQHELWHKENMINLGVQHLTKLDPNWKYVAWIDADVAFQRRDIVAETVHQLQHYDIVQLFSHAIDLDPLGKPILTQEGFMYSYLNGIGAAGEDSKTKILPRKWFTSGDPYDPYSGEWTKEVKIKKKTNFWHCGFAWAARRRVFDKMQLLDTPILGSADHSMAMSMIGYAEKSIMKGTTKGYAEPILVWQDMIEHHVKRNVGYVSGTLTHGWHGTKKNRNYVNRWDIIIKNKFNPYTDLSRDAQGLYRLLDYDSPRYRGLRDDIRDYFRQRQEDCIYTGD
jgi:hypothetical protein